MLRCETFLGCVRLKWTCKLYKWGADFLSILKNFRYNYYNKMIVMFFKTGENFLVFSIFFLHSGNLICKILCMTIYCHKVDFRF